MALSAGIITQAVTDAAGFDAISLMVQQYLKENAVLIPTIQDETDEATPGKKSTSYTRIGELVAEDKTDGTEYTAQKFEVAADKLEYDTQQGVYVQLTSKGSLQSAIAQEPKIFERSLQALTDALEQKIYTALANVSTSAPDHAILFDTQSTLALSDILEARRLLNVAKVPLTDRFLAIHPNNETDLLNLKQFTNASEYGDRVPLLTGEIGRIFGFRTVITGNVTENTALGYHRSHVVFGRQMEVTWDQDKILQNSAREYLLETLYGLKTLDNGVRGVKIANS